MSFCHCEFCKRYQRFQNAMNSNDRSKIKAMCKELHNSLCCAEEDLSWHRSVLDGSWPNAIGILNRSLEAAKKIRESD